MKVRLSAVKLVPKSRTFDRGSKKNGLFTITLFESDHGSSVMNHHKQYRKLNCNKEDYAVCLGDWKGVVFFELLPRNQTNNVLRFGCEVMLPCTIRLLFISIFRELLEW